MVKFYFNFMLRIFLITVLFFLSQTSFSVGQGVVAWGSQEGVERLSSSLHKVDFFKLVNNFAPQTNKIFCGPASAAIVLNSLRARNVNFNLPEDASLLKKQDLIYLPIKDGWSPFYKRYTSNNVLTKSPKARAFILGKPVKAQDGKLFKDFGLQLYQLSALLKAHNLAVATYVVNDKANYNYLKQVLIDNLKIANDYVIVNYKRGSLNQPGGGHISPLAAYHQGSDSFLILDTAPNTADWVWVDADLLISAMSTFDTVENRGFVTVREHYKDYH